MLTKSVRRGEWENSNFGSHFPGPQLKRKLNQFVPLLKNRKPIVAVWELPLGVVCSKNVALELSPWATISPNTIIRRKDRIGSLPSLPSPYTKLAKQIKSAPESRQRKYILQMLIKGGQNVPLLRVLIHSCFELQTMSFRTLGFSTANSLLWHHLLQRVRSH